MGLKCFQRGFVLCGDWSCFKTLYSLLTSTVLRSQDILNTFSFKAKGTPELDGNLSYVFVINEQLVSTLFVRTFKVTGDGGGWG